MFDWFANLEALANIFANVSEIVAKYAGIPLLMTSFVHQCAD